jgi:FAD/FMN-containing dehydrogenase
MSSAIFAPALPNLLAELRELVGPANVIDQGDSLETLSKDFYWYSPVLKRQLDDKRADLAVRPGSVDELRAVLVACARARVPVVPRGGGTGNYGQCIPLYGGVVIDLSRLDKFEITSDGVLRSEPGARIGSIEPAARAAGWEMRCIPSTWVKSSIAGFFCGGSGGIGSITWGGIASADNVKSVTLLTCETEPRVIRLSERDSLTAIHTYGTTGFMIELEMRLAPKRDYDQLIFSSPDWEKTLTWIDSAARNDSWPKRLCSLFEDHIAATFKPLQKHLRPGEHCAFLLTEKSVTAAVVASAEAAGLNTAYNVPLADPLKPPYITDYTWNHTTLWVMKTYPTYTYLQAGFGENFRERFAQLKARFPGEIYLHVMWNAANPKTMVGEDDGTLRTGENINVGGIPIVAFTTEDRLNEIIDYCAEIGVGIANPHAYTLEGGGRHPNLPAKLALKADVDPHGLLNPGKMSTYAHNPFA